MKLKHTKELPLTMSEKLDSSSGDSIQEQKNPTEEAPKRGRGRPKGSAKKEGEEVQGDGEEAAKKGPSSAEIRANIRCAIDRHPAAKYVFPAPFPTIFHRQRMEGGAYRVLLEDDRGVVSLTSEEDVCTVYSKWATSLGYGFGAYQGEPHHVQKWVLDWCRHAPLLSEPIATVLQAHSPGRCWHRLDFDMDATQETPVFDALCSRMVTNREPFLAWLGAVFDPEARLQQYAWLYGHGGDGKGSLFEFLRLLLGRAFATLETNPRVAMERFTTSSYIGKRLLVDSDCGYPDFVTSSEFKKLTGGDPIRFEGKGKDAYTDRLDALCLVGSNKKPRITNAQADLRRAMFVEFRKRQEHEDVDNFRDRLWEERAGILAKVWRSWAAVRKPGLSAIPVDDCAHRALADEADSDFWDMADEFLEFGQKCVVSRCAVVELVRSIRKDDGRCGRKFYDFLVRQDNIKRVPRARPGIFPRPPEHLIGVTLNADGWRLLDKKATKFDMDQKDAF